MKKKHKNFINVFLEDVKDAVVVQIFQQFSISLAINFSDFRQLTLFGVF
jgi:hypothetical protein